MSNYNQGLLDAYEACQGVRESGCESAQGASECCTAIRDLINSTPPVLATPANSAVLPEPHGKGVVCHTADQLRAYGQACAAAERTAILNLVLSKAYNAAHNDDSKAEGAYHNVATAIRART